MLRDTGFHEIWRKHVSDQVHQRVDSRNVLRLLLNLRGSITDARLDRNNENYTYDQNLTGKYYMLSVRYISYCFLFV